MLILPPVGAGRAALRALPRFARGSGHPIAVPLCLLLFVAGSPPALADAPLSVAVLPLEAKYGIDAGLASLLSDNFTQVVRDCGAFGRVVAAKEMESLLGAERITQLAQCDSEGCMAEMVGALGVDFVMSGNVGKVGASWLLNARILDVRKAVTVASISHRAAGGSEDRLLDTVTPAVAKLLDGARLKHTLPEPPVQSAAGPAAAAPETPQAAPASSFNGLRIAGGVGLGLAVPFVLGLLALGALFGGIFVLDLVLSQGQMLGGVHRISATTALVGQAALLGAALLSLPAVLGVVASVALLAGSALL